MEKQKFLLLWLAGLSIGCSQQRPAEEMPQMSMGGVRADSCYTRRYIFAQRDTAEAFRLIDEGVYYGKIALADARLTRAQVWQNNGDTDRSRDYILRYLDNDSVQLVPRRKMMYYDFLMRGASSRNQSAEAIRYGKDMALAAREAGREDKEAYADFTVAYEGVRLNNFDPDDENMARMFRALERLEKAPTEERMPLLHCYAKMNTVLGDMGKVEEMIQNCMREEHYLATQEATPIFDEYWLTLYGSLTWAYINTNQERKAQEAFEKWKQLSGSESVIGRASVFSSLLSTKWGYREALEWAPEIYTYFKEHHDTRQCANVYYQLYRCYRRIGDYRQAMDAMHKADSLSIKYSQEKAAEEGQKWAKQYELQQREFELERRDSENLLLWVCGVAAFVLFLLAAMSAVVYWRAACKMRKKNQMLVRRMDEIERYRTEISQLRYNARHNVNKVVSNDKISDEELTQMLDEKTTGEQLYKLPSLSLEEMAKRLNITQARMKRWLQAHPDYNRIQDYLDEKRVLRACTMIRTHPGNSMQEVCDFGGFTNIRAFNRKFKAIMGMTPIEYKRSSMVNSDPAPSGAYPSAGQRQR